MASSPPIEGASWCDGDSLGQGQTAAYGREIWLQESDWNRLWIPNPMDEETQTYAIDADLYLPAGLVGGAIEINATMGDVDEPGTCNNNSGGLGLAYTQLRCDSCPNLNVFSNDEYTDTTSGDVTHYTTSDRDDVFDRWVNVRFEVFRSDGLVQVFIDDELETSFMADAADLYGPYILFRGYGGGYPGYSSPYPSPQFGISNLTVSTGS